MKSLVIAFLAVALWTAGCTAEQQDGNASEVGSNLAYAEISDERPSITILDPPDGATLTSPFMMKVEVTGFALAPAGRTRDGEGHWHVLLDGCLAPGTVIPKDEMHFHVGTGVEETTLELPPGDHELCVQVGDGFHVAVAIVDTITVTVEAN